jgi:hypothetical protein
MNTTAVPHGRQRQPLKPVHVSGRFVGGANRQDVIDGSAVLAVTDMDTGEEKPYWLQALYAEGRCVGFSLREFGSEEEHVLPRELTSCSCGDATYRPGRPGGCRHRAALRQALPAVAMSEASRRAGPAERPNRR